MASKPASKFQKPAWLQKKLAAQSQALQKDNATPESAEKKDAVDIFKRSADTQAIIAAEQENKERRLREKREREEQEQRELDLKARQRILERTEAARISSQEPESKRRRISPDEGYEPSFLNTSKSPSQTPSCRNVEPVSKPLHITIDDSDDDDNDKSYIPPASKTTAAPIPAAAPTPEAIIILSDDEDNQAGQAQKDGSTAVEEDFPDSSDDEGPNPVLTVFIVPRIPNTKPLLVKRKYNQVLKDVRLAWCKHNNLTPAETATIIFTWRDRRVFDIQSCKSLGIKIDEDGIPYILTDDIRAELENVALIATTRNIMEEEKRDEKKRTELIPDEPSEQPSQTATSEPTGEQQYKVVLRSKSYPDQKLILKEDTTMHKVAVVFRRQNKVEADKEIRVMYDGDSLSPELQVKDAEFIDDYEGDIICLEVHVA